MSSGAECSQIHTRYNLNVTYVGKVMEVPLYVEHNQYCGETVHAWQYLWNTICKMCYEDGDILEEIITFPGRMRIDDSYYDEKFNTELEHVKYYSKRYPINDENLVLDSIWKQYSQKAGPDFVPHVIPGFRRLHVPADLFYSVGVEQWFRECFPNCKVTFWEH